MAVALKNAVSTVFFQASFSAIYLIAVYLGGSSRHQVKLYQRLILSLPSGLDTSS